jgi:drug/metabolite transporter (DMT)-like permease
MAVRRVGVNATPPEMVRRTTLALSSSSRVALLTVLAMVAFAANSVLTRAALGHGELGALGFTAIRLASAAAALFLLAGGRTAVGSGTWTSAAALTAYALPFSLAYLQIGAALGALILFAAVQVTMIGWDVSRGARPTRTGWTGIALAIAGLVGLTLPGSRAVDPVGAVFVAVTGVAWGVYSIRGRTTRRPLAATADNFYRCAPFACCFAIAALIRERATLDGVLLAVSSGVLASGVGYAIWYAVLPSLGATLGAVVQLSVPMIAALGGIGVLSEPVTFRWLSCAASILGGIALVVFSARGGR